MAYSTTFPLTENPISEGGVWLQHNTNRAKVLTTGGNAFGTGTNNDGYAYLAGAGDSVIETTVFRDATLGDADPNSYEIEHLHRLTDDAGNTTCYELDFSYTNGFNIVRWSGATSFAVLSGLVTDANFFPDGGGGQLRNGHKIKSECVLTPSPRINIYADTGSGYTLFFHYVLGADATNDNPPLATGDPAISFFTTIGSSNLFGMSDATITSLSSPVIVVPTTSRAGRGPGQGPRLRRMAPQQFPTPAPTDTVTPTPTATPFHIGGGTSGKGIPQRRRIPQQFPDTIPFVQDGSATQTPFRIGRGGGIGTPVRRMFPQQYPTAAAVTNVTVALTGASAIFSAGALGVIHTQALTGASATFVAGTVKAALSKALTGAQGTFTAGSVKSTLAKALTGQRATFTPGIASSSLSRSLTGSSAIFGPGTVVPVTGFVVALTGARAQFSSGLLSAVAQSVQTQFSGGWEYARRARRRLEEELRAEREQWGILPKAAQIVSAVAIRQADALDLDAQQRLEELERELELAGVRYQAQYLELLNLQRQRLIDAEIRGFFEAEEALGEENKRRLMLLLAFLS